MDRLSAFDEAEYLAANPDVAHAIETGVVASGKEHYERHGRLEGRPLRTRRGKLRGGLDVSRMTGLEIGALDSPTVGKHEGDVIFVDYADRDFLRHRYRDDPHVHLDQIVEVDAIWGENTLRDAVGGDRRVDYVLASHVAEHVPDLITWLNEIHSVLNPGGSVRLVVPDKRYTFDYLRAETRLHDILDAYIRRARTPLPRAILDFCMLARVVDARAAWRGELDVETLPRMSFEQDAISTARDAYENGSYHDVHCWVFTPASFVNLMQEVGRLGLVRLRCEEIVSTEYCQAEFFVVMAPGDDPDEIAASWTQASEMLRTEPVADVSPPPLAAEQIGGRAAASVLAKALLRRLRAVGG
jgi:SAM-dependent methyltransferase